MAMSDALGRCTQQAKNTVLSHCYLVSAMLALHREKACIMSRDPEAGAAQASQHIRMLLSKYREVYRDDELLSRLKAKAHSQI